MDDETYVKEKYRAHFGVYPDLSNPVKFTEKIQWIKLNMRDPKMTVYCDKYLVKEHIKEVLGEEYVIPLLGVYDSPNQIDFDTLPERFVLKCNHNSGRGMYICKDKSNLNVKKVRRDLRAALKEDYYFVGREWSYRDVPRKIVCEKYMEDSGGNLTDYKFYCNQGKATHLLVCLNRLSDNHRNIHMNMKGEILPFNPDCVKAIEAGEKIKLPSNFDEMKAIAEKLSSEFPHVRIDLYNVDGKIYFGEYTFYSDSGFFTRINGGDEYIGKDVILPLT